MHYNNVKDKSWVGKKFGSLTVVDTQYVPERSRWMWLCRCDCGNIVLEYPNPLMRGKQKACSCGKAANAKKVAFRHGESKTRLYGIWCDIHRRCNNPANKSYKWYGGKGIKVCEEWSSYENFRNWAVLAGYTDSLTIDRVSSEIGYQPNNCRWVDRKAQAQNRRSTLFVQIGGETRDILDK